MLFNTYISIQRKWSYRALVINSASLIIILVILKDPVESGLGVVRFVLAEVSAICWALQMSIALIAIGPTLKRLGVASDESVLTRVLAEGRVERRIKSVMIVGTVTFAALLNVAISLRDVSMYIPVLYFFLVSLIVTLSANVTSRWLLQGVVLSALQVVTKDGDHQDDAGFTR